MRLSACLAVPLDIIEPCAFPLSDKSLRRAALDYGDKAEFRLHRSWREFLSDPLRLRGRLILFTTRGGEPHHRFQFHPGDTLLMGRESAGVPEEVHASAQARLFIPLAPGMRSLNVVVAASIGLGEALRQTRGFPGFEREGAGG